MTSAPQHPAPPAEFSVTRLATVIFSALALMFALGLLQAGEVQTAPAGGH